MRSFCRGSVFKSADEKFGRGSGVVAFTIYRGGTPLPHICAALGNIAAGRRSHISVPRLGISWRAPLPHILPRLGISWRDAVPHIWLPLIV